MLVVLAATGYQDLSEVEPILLRQGLSSGDWLYIGSSKSFDTLVLKIAKRHDWLVSHVDLGRPEMSPDEKLTQRDERLIALALKYQFSHKPYPPRVLFFAASGNIGGLALVKRLAEANSINISYDKPLVR